MTRRLVLISDVFSLFTFHLVSFLLSCSAIGLTDLYWIFNDFLLFVLIV